MRVSWCVPALLFAAACSAPGTRATLPAPGPSAPEYVRVRVVENGRAVIRQVPLEFYVEGATLAEVTPSSGDAAVVERMLEVQAVVSRTYALAHLGRHGRDGFDLCATTHCQLYDPSRLRSSRWAPSAEQAVRRTSGVVLWYDLGPADTLYHADCGGRTARPSDVWGSAGAPYLKSETDDGPARHAHTTWRYEVEATVLLKALTADPRTRVGGPLRAIDVVERDRSGRAERVALHGSGDAIVRGDELRDVLSRALGARSLRSTWFNVERDGPAFVFTGRGFGHGVGLCQAGAFARIRAGARLESVLEHYYPGTKLVTTSPRTFG